MSYETPFKLDVQGAEKDVMMGGLDIIREAKVLFIELPVIQYNKGLNC